MINEMTTNIDCSKAADMVHSFNLNPDDFPELKKRLKKKCMRYFKN